jgi:predicted DNA-binding transcriptional regulator AlpA
MAVQLINQNQFRIKLGDCSRSTFWRYRNSNTDFPVPVNLGGQDLWEEEKADKWIISKLTQNKKRVQCEKQVA